ncbi:transposase [Paenibacillus sp. FSL H8-0548]|uniref:transposase n=1 Tax=Paenibacillus sp. FSL H8-0548 TaxID=1920422 RepID=UPI00117BF577|nr:transposase [Paenibacillus sp. FSL H8-0548]
MYASSIVLSRTSCLPARVVSLNSFSRRPSSVIRIFPNREAAVRMIGAVLMEIEEHWETSRKFMDMTAHHEWRKNR